jgi:hypothetical protein
MLVVLLLLPLSLAMDDGELDHGSSNGGSCSLAAVAAAAVVAVDNNWQWKQPATRALTVAWWRVMTKADSGQQCNNQPTTGAVKAGGGGGGDGDSNGSGDKGDNGGSSGGKDNGGHSDGDVLYFESDWY